MAWHFTATEADPERTQRQFAGPVLRMRRTLTALADHEVLRGPVLLLILIDAFPIRLQPSDARPEKVAAALATNGSETRPALAINPECPANVSEIVRSTTAIHGSGSGRRSAKNRVWRRPKLPPEGNDPPILQKNPECPASVQRMETSPLTCSSGAPPKNGSPN